MDQRFIQTGPGRSQMPGRYAVSRHRLVAVLLASAALATASCGKSASGKPTGASSPTPTTATSTQVQLPPVPGGPLSRTQLISTADTICRRVAAKRNLLKFGSELQYLLILPTIASYQRTLYAGLRKLTPPASMAGDWHRIVDDTRILRDSMVKLNQLAKSGQRTHKVHVAAMRLDSVFALGRRDMQATARRDHFADCSTY